MATLYSELNMYTWWYLRQAETINNSIIATNFISVRMRPRITISSPYILCPVYGGGHIGFKMAANVEIEVANVLFMRTDIYGVCMPNFLLTSLTARFFYTLCCTITEMREFIGKTWLRQTRYLHKIHIPNTTSINWSMLSSSEPMVDF